MSAVEERIDVDALVPDGIEPVEAHRCWTLDGGELQSLNGGGAGATWTPGEPMTAKCNASGGERYVWNVVRRGMTAEAALAHAAYLNQQYVTNYRHPYFFYGGCPPPPTVALPDGYGFGLETIRHDAPDESCTCGIYAAATAKSVPESGNVYGKVKLWGKVVPGDKGYRAQYAYPSEFRVHPSLADDPVLQAFGVPIVVDDKLAGKTPSSVLVIAGMGIPAITKRSAGLSPLRIAIGVNMGCAALNLTLLAAGVLH